MAIPNPNPIVVPAVEKTYPHIWIRSFQVVVEGTAKGSLVIEYFPYNVDTGEILTSAPKVISTDRFWELIAAEPLANSAMESVFVGFNAIKNWVDENPS